MAHNNDKLRKIEDLENQTNFEESYNNRDCNGSCGYGSSCDGSCGCESCCYGSCGWWGSYNGSCGCGTHEWDSCGCESGEFDWGAHTDEELNGFCGCCGCGSKTYVEEFSAIRTGCGWKGSPTGCADSYATGSAPDTLEEAKNIVNVMNNPFVRGRIEMMTEEVSRNSFPYIGAEYGCMIYYDMNKKEYIGGKFIKGTDGTIKISKDLQTNGYQGSGDNIVPITVIHVHPSLTYEANEYNIREVGPSNADYKAIKNFGFDYGIVIDYKGKEENYVKNNENEHGSIIHANHGMNDARQFHIINGKETVYSGDF